MLEPLKEQDIGDEESRSLFAAALEYDLASCRRLTESAKESPPPVQRRSESKDDVALAALAEAARGLAQWLAGLDEAASHRLQRRLGAADRFRRNYGEDYLESLRSELWRVADIGNPTEQATPAPTREPALSEDTRRFVLRAADTFRDCFELATDAQPGSPFVTALEAIVAATGIRMATDQPTLACGLDEGGSPPFRSPGPILAR